MPLLSRAFIKSGMIFFALSLLSGIALQIEGLPLPPLAPLFWHTLMLGWITQIIMGVSFWMFPGRAKEESFSKQKFGWLMFLSLNAGLLLRMISEPFIYTSPNSWLKIVLVISAILQFVAAIFYVFEIWPRIMSKEKSIQKRRKAR